MPLSKAQLVVPPGGPGGIGGVSAGSGVTIDANGVISASGGGGGTGATTTITPIPGIEQATNVQRALELIELQAQDRVEFVTATTAGLQISITPPVTTSYDGTTARIGLDSASITAPGIVQLTNDITGNSQTQAVTQFGVSTLNAKVDALTGANALAGTYNSTTGLVVSVTPAGTAAGFTVGAQAPQAINVPDNYYLIVVVGGNLGPPGAILPPTGVQSGDWFVNEKETGVQAKWVTIDFENRVVDASQVNLSPVPGLSATNVQAGIAQLATAAGGSIIEIISNNNGITVAETAASTLGRDARITLNPANSTDIGGVYVAPNFGLNVNPAGGLSLAAPTSTTLGGVKAGANITIAADGTISASGGGGGSEFPAGTSMVFAQAAAPPGWTTDTGLDNAALRLVTSGGGGTGGSDDFTTAFSSYTPTGNVGVNLSGLSISGGTTNQASVSSSGNVSVSVSVQGAGLAESQIASHTHQVPSVFCNGQQSNPRSAGNGAGDGTRVSNAAGGGGQHSHGASANASFSGGSSSHSHNVSGSVGGSASGSFSGNARSFSVRYKDVIICVKG
jgi:hypothetical protein